MTDNKAADLSIDRSEFKFFLPVRVHYADTDAQQVVYYGSYLRFLEAGRQEYWRRMGIVLNDLLQQGYLLVIVDIACTYFRPAFYDDVLDIYVRTPRLRARSFDIEYLVVRRKEDSPVAAARTTFVFVENKTWKAVPIPDGFRAAVEQFEEQA
jgi:acyl-CoA thioester hydrolase